MDTAGVRERALLQSTQMVAVVFLGDETRLAIIAALHDVVRNAGELEAGQASHAELATWLQGSQQEALRRSAN